MQPQNFDYTPLQKLKSKSISPAYIIVYLISMGLWVAAMVYIISYNKGIGSLVLLILGFFVLIFGYAGWEYLRARKIDQENAVTYQEFAATNNLAYQADGGDVKNRPGTLFEPGHTKKIQNVISGQLDAFPFSSYVYHYETGGGKSHQVFDVMVLEVTLPRVLPQFVIDAELEHVVPLLFDKSQKIELEGNFHKYFNLYAPDSYGVTALTLLAPDVMEVLMDRAAFCDIEVVKNKLYFYWPTPAKNASHYEQMFTITQAVLAKSGDNLAHKDIYATNTQKQIHAQPAAGGVRLKRSHTTAIIIVIIGVLYFAAILIDNTRYEIYGELFMSVAIPLFIGWMILSAYRYERLRKEYAREYRRDYTK